MKSGLLFLSLVAISALNAAEPMVPSSMSTDRGGAKAAIDAYSDGGGAMLYDAGAKAVYDNSSMNQLVFTYGDVAKESGITITNQVKSIDQTATPVQKALADKIPGSNLSINPPVNGSPCNDFNHNTSDDVFVNGVCKGTFTSGKCDDGDLKTIDDVWHSDGSCYGNNVEGISCDDQNSQTIDDVWHNGVCAGNNVEGKGCDDKNDQTINDIWHNGVCNGTNVEGQSCDDKDVKTINDVWHNGVCAGNNVEGKSCNDNLSYTYADKYISGVCSGTIAKSCRDILSLMPSSQSGQYSIKPESTSFIAQCDMSTNGGGWTLVFYSNSDSLAISAISGNDWNSGPAINFSRLWSMRNIKNASGVYEFWVKDSSTIGRYITFTQTNAYNANPNGNGYIKTGGNFTYYGGRTWFGLALGTYGETNMATNCTLAMSAYGSTWNNCIQDHLSGQYGTGPWYTNGTSADAGAYQWIQIWQR